ADSYINISGCPDKGTIAIYDMSGKQWYCRNVANDVETIPVGHLPCGNYIIRIVGEAEGRSVKMVKL
ncbi:MAG: T9SS type A sorting domain-containing protein, partial [Bacteroidales bacterium]|nr:T9SS type A sorting domain-containing protein [Bacteroidales bacterium]